jgi:hypothetical protein
VLHRLTEVTQQIPQTQDRNPELSAAARKLVTKKLILIYDLAPSQIVSIANNRSEAGLE